MRRLSATGTLLLAMAGLIPAVPARAADGATGTITIPSPVAGSANATFAALANAHCNVSDPSVVAVQGGDGFAIDMGGPVSFITLDPAGGDGAIPADLDVYFLSDQCAYAGSLATTDKSEHGQPQLCTLNPLTGSQTCAPTTPRYAVVTMTTGAATAFTLTWAS